MRYIG
jgi:hypothetical protein